jgi:hypothetical protein
VSYGAPFENRRRGWYDIGFVPTSYTDDSRSTVLRQNFTPVISHLWSPGSPKQTAFELDWLTSSLPTTRPEL